MTFINYRASAGSGKTYQLVLEYLSLALQHEGKFRHILAITFTNKAAAEMKERILRSLKELSNGQNPELKKNLLEKEKSLTNIEKRSGRLLKKILHNYSNFAVTTIDSFINRLVRAFTYETGIPAGFDVELNLSRMDRFVIRNIFADIGVDPETTKIILEFVFDRINRNSSWNVESEIRSLLKEINQERREGQLKKLADITPAEFLDMAGGIKKALSEFMEDILGLALRGKEIIDSSGVPFHEYAYKDKGAAAYLVKLSGLGKYQVKKYFDMGDRNFRKGAWTAGTMTKDIREKIEAVEPELNSVHGSLIRIKDERERKIKTLLYIYENIFLLGLIGKIGEYLNEYKWEYNVVPIYDLTKNVHTLISQGDIPFVYYILGDSFEHIMIDEFQDTSQMQWDTLFPLIENSVSEKKKSLGVGDLKQSIYRWRGGDTDIMDQLIHHQFRPWGGVEQKDLLFNYRSASHIVEFNNRLFDQVNKTGGANEFFSRIYTNPSQTTTGKGAGYVSLTFISRDDPGEPIAERVESAVRKCLAAGYPLSDIAVLTRKKVRGMEIANHLIARKIRIVTPELLLLHRNPTALFLTDLLKYTENNSEDNVLADILFYISKYFAGISWDNRSTEIYFTGRDERILPRCVREFFSRRSLLLRLPLYEAVEELIRIFELNRSLKYSSSGFITAYLDMIREFYSKESGSISAFLEWWDEYGADFSASTPENSGGVTIMTIHKAKGLEFPVVLIPDSDWREKSGNHLWLGTGEPDMDIHGYNPPYLVKDVSGLESTCFAEEYEAETFRSELDDLNLFYVACTRAKEALFLFAGIQTEKEGKHSNYRLLRDTAGSGFFDSETGGLFEKGVLKKESSPEKKEAVRILTDNELISSNWSDKITIRERSEKYWDLTPEEQIKNIDRGILIHEILSEIGGETTPETVLRRMQHSGRIDEFEREEVGRAIREMFRSPEVRDWFYGEGEHFREQSLLTSRGTYRPDRVIISKNSVRIIDFKTGRESDRDMEQMREYKSLVSSMGYSHVRGLLYYLSQGKIKEV